MAKSRREFIRESLTIVGGSLLGYSCGKRGGGFVEEINQDYFDKYDFEVNTTPYKEMNFVIEEDISSEKGELSYYPFRQEIYNFNLVDSKNNFISGLEGLLHKQKNSEKGFLFVGDEKRNYFPTLIFPSYLKSSKESSSYFAKIPMKEELDSIFDKFIVKKFEEMSPSWDWDKLDDEPGMIYLGDWSIENASKTFGFLAGLGTIALSGGSSALITNTVGLIVGANQAVKGIEELVDAYNFVVPSKYEIDKTEQHAIYLPFFPGSEKFASFIFGPTKGNSLFYKGEKFEELFPTKIGTEWKYNSPLGNSSFKVNGMETFKGKNLVSFQNVGGLKEYFGYEGNNFKQYGMNYPQIGNVFFDPPLKFSNDMVKTGDKIVSTSSVVFENYPEIKGSIELEIYYKDRDFITTPLSTFGGVFQVDINSSINATIEGESVSDDSFESIYLAKNVGKVRHVLQGYRFDLIESNVGRVGVENKSVKIEKENFMNSKMKNIADKLGS